jgi:hypothetical protein
MRKLPTMNFGRQIITESIQTTKKRCYVAADKSA